MTPQPTFPAVFVKALQAKEVAAAPDATLFDETASTTEFGRPLIQFGTGKDRFIFSELGVDFKDQAGTSGRYSWDQLDFILPLDLSLAHDKLYTFTDISGQAHRAALSKGLSIALGIFVALIAMLSILVVVILYSVVSFLVSLPIWALVLVAVVFFIFLPIVLAVVGGIIAAASLSTATMAFVATGVIGAMSIAFAQRLQPSIERRILIETNGFKNGLFLIKDKWIKATSDSQTTVIFDFILIAIKLWRVGLR